MRRGAVTVNALDGADPADGVDSEGPLQPGQLAKGHGTDFHGPGMVLRQRQHARSPDAGQHVRSLRRCHEGVVKNEKYVVV